MHIYRWLVINLIKDTIRIKDDKTAEKRYRRRKFKYSNNIINSSAREELLQDKIIILVIKCIHELNHYRLRIVLINNNGIEEMYPRYTEIEPWEDVIKCSKTIPFKKVAATDLACKMTKIDYQQVVVDEIFAMIKKIMRNMKQTNT